MSENSVDLRRKIAGAGDLQSVVRSMKAVAAASLGQYQRSVLALDDYYRTVELGLGLCLRQGDPTDLAIEQKTKDDSFGVIVFGSDQGLVGRFNDVVANYAAQELGNLPGRPQVWAVGERVHARLQDAGLTMLELFVVPSSVEAIAVLVGQIQVQIAASNLSKIYVFHNRPKTEALYEPVNQRLLPFDARWQKDLESAPWPTGNLPEAIGPYPTALRALVREYLFISLFRACAESLASENASRLSAMERADRNVKDQLESLGSAFRRLRQNSIDEELFDVVSGFEALSK